MGIEADSFDEAKAKVRALPGLNSQEHPSSITRDTNDTLRFSIGGQKFPVYGNMIADPLEVI